MEVGGEGGRGRLVIQLKPLDILYYTADNVDFYDGLSSSPPFQPFLPSNLSSLPFLPPLLLFLFFLLSLLPP